MAVKPLVFTGYQGLSDKGWDFLVFDWITASASKFGQQLAISGKNAQRIFKANIGIGILAWKFRG